MATLADSVKVNLCSPGDDAGLGHEFHRPDSIRQNHLVRSQVGVRFLLGDHGWGLIGAAGLSIAFDVPQFLVHSCGCGIIGMAFRQSIAREQTQEDEEKKKERLHGLSAACVAEVMIGETRVLATLPERLKRAEVSLTICKLSIPSRDAAPLIL